MKGIFFPMAGASLAYILIAGSGPEDFLSCDLIASFAEEEEEKFQWSTLPPNVLKERGMI
jgi:hypothetical protein